MNPSQIIDVANPSSWDRMILNLNKVKRFSFDTEYDCFRRYYGFTLFLLSVYDGERVYLIDAKKINDFSDLWNLMEDASICKVLYSGSEDLALLHSMGCRFRNLFDVQIAAYFANHPARGLSDLIASETGRKLNKSSQLSDWSKRPLSIEQREYAANDVNALLEIADKLNARVLRAGLEGAMAEEFLCLEEVVPRDFSPKLKPFYYRDHSLEYCRVLLDAYVWRDHHARCLNVPPHYVIGNELLEKYLFDVSEKHNIDPKGFHPKILALDNALRDLNEIRDSFDASKVEMFQRTKTHSTKRLSRDEEANRIELLYNPVSQRITSQFGEVAGTYLLRNIKRHLISGADDSGKLRKYQEKILSEMLALA